MSGAERHAAVQLLRESFQRLLDTVRPLTDSQARWKETPASWSVLENLEHLSVTEAGLFVQIQAALQTSAEAAVLERIRGRDAKIAQAVRGRIVKVEAPPETVPTGRFSNLEPATDACKAARQQWIDLASNMAIDLRAHTHRHYLLKDLDLYQWLVFLTAHMDRHLVQIEEVLANPEFPATSKPSI